MSAALQKELEALLTEAPEEDRGGHAVDALAAAWRFAGVTDLAQVRAWLSLGVFDGQRARLLMLAGLAPNNLHVLPNARDIGFAFARGKMSVNEVIALVATFEAAQKITSADQSTVRTKKAE